MKLKLKDTAGIPLRNFNRGDIVRPLSGGRFNTAMMVTSGEDGWDVIVLTGNTAGDLLSYDDDDLFIPAEIELA